MDNTKEQAIPKPDIKDLSVVEVLERISAELESYIRFVEHDSDAEMGLSYNLGIAVARSVVHRMLDELRLEIDGEYVIYHYRGRRIRILRDKYDKVRPEYSDIAQYLLSHADKTGLDPFNINDEEIAARYSVEQIEKIVDNSLDKILMLYGDDGEPVVEDPDFDEEAFRKQCEELTERMLRGEAEPEDFPDTDTSQKLGILVNVLFPPKEEELRKMGFDPRPITIEERIERSKKRFF